MTRERKISPEARALLEKLAATDLEYRDAVVTLEARIRDEVEEKLRTIRTRRDILAHQTHEAGAPVTWIARDGLHTTATVSAYAAIKEGKKYAGGETADAAQSTGPQRFELLETSGGIVFNPTAEDLAPILAKLDLEPMHPEDASATFMVEDGIITPRTPAILPSGTMNPIVAMVMADGSKHGRALVEFAEAAA